MADGHHVSGPAHVQVGPREGDEARVGHCMLVPGEGKGGGEGQRAREETQVVQRLTNHTRHGGKSYRYQGEILFFISLQMEHEQVTQTFHKSHTSVCRSL